MRISITHIRPNFLDVQEAMCSFSQQCQSRDHLAGRRFVCGCFTSEAMSGIRSGNFSSDTSHRKLLASATWQVHLPSFPTQHCSINHGFN